MRKIFTSAFLIAMAATAIAQPCNQSVVATYNDPLCIGKDLQLTATFIPGASYEWHGPSSYVSFFRNSTISNTSFLTSGNYEVTATLGSCVYKDTVTVQVQASPPIPTLVYKKPACEGDSLLLMSQTTGGISTYIWDPMGNTFIAQGNITSAVNGQYTSVAVSAIGCVSDTAKLMVNVLSNPQPPVITQAKTACTGDTIALNAYAPGGISNFLFFDPQGKLTPPIIGGVTFAHSGYYKCVAVSTAGCTSDTAQINVLVHPTIVPGVAIYGSGEAGLYGTVNFTSLISNATSPTFTWMRNGSPIPGANSNTYSAIVGYTIMPGDMVSLQVSTNVSPCPGTGHSNNITIATNLSVNDIDNKGGYAVFPNPSNGIIHIKTNTTEAYRVDIMNTIGSIVYSANGSGNLSFDVTGKLAAGNYIIRISDSKHAVSNKLNITQ